MATMIISAERKVLGMGTVAALGYPKIAQIMSTMPSRMMHREIAAPPA
jgi:hypothetical protein